MSNHLAIATVTGTLRRTLHAAVQQDVTSAVATSVRPDVDGATPTTGVNIFLYQVTPNPSWRNSDLPTRNARGDVVQRPRIALDLHYLFTFYGDEGLLEPQRVLGSVARLLHARPYITRAAISATLGDALFGFLGGSDLADEVELVKFTPSPFNLEELSKLWSVLLQTPYALSMSYMATVVLIEAAETPRRALPVRARNIEVNPFRHAIIDEVVAVDGDDEPIEMGDTIIVRGSQLDGTITRVRVGVADLAPVADTQTSSELRVALTDPALRAGVLGVQIRFADGSESNVAPLVLRPGVTVNAGVTSTAVPIGFSPPVSRVQRVVLFLNELNVGLGHEPFAHSFEAPENNGIAAPNIEETPEITFAISGVAAGTYLVRVHVNGAENVLAVEGDDTLPTFGMYINPRVVIP